MGDMTNPYSAPRSDEDGPRGEVYSFDLIDASSGVRFANMLIDNVLYMVICFVLGVVSVVIEQPTLISFLTWPALIGYYLFFESVFDATPGKMITRTRVVRLDGGKPSFGQIFGRTLSRLVPFEALSFLGSSGGWHDRWSKTRVVRRS